MRLMGADVFPIRALCVSLSAGVRISPTQFLRLFQWGGKAPAIPNCVLTFGGKSDGSLRRPIVSKDKLIPFG